MYDIIVIGGGVVGCAILRELSRYKIKSLLIEKQEDVGCGSSKANSGIVHAGYDAEEGTLKAKFNLAGNEMYKALCNELNVPFKQIGSLVLSNSDKLDEIKKLYNRGLKNGIVGMEILNRQEIIKIEPNVADEIEYALYAPTAAIVSPYELTVALAQQAIVNESEILLGREIVDIVWNGKNFVIIDNIGNEYESLVVINSAGYASEKMCALIGEQSEKTTYKRGDYFILDSAEGDKFKHVCFPLPDEKGKGILVSPTAEGNIIVGPTNITVERGDDTAVEEDALELIKTKAISMVKNLNFKKVIRVFAGVRSICGNDFIIKNGKNPNFIKLQGICSPGLTSAPSIAKYVVENLMKNTQVTLVAKNEFKSLPKRIITRNLSKQEWAMLIESRSDYAHIVCRCEKITEGEINDCLNGPLPPKSLDALKRRVRTGMGRCQGGFCSPRVMEIFSKFYNIPLEDVTKCGKGSEIVVGGIKS
ncbi:MAG: NAD(P)/FAD-dependent oxidoreductase [Clostridia bacterium]